MQSTSEFLATIESFLERAKMAPTRLGALALADPAFVIKLRRGRKTTIDRAKRVLDFMDGYLAEHGAERPSPCPTPPTPTANTPP